MHLRLFSEQPLSDRTLLRMDSLMVESNIRKLSRIQLLFRCMERSLGNIAPNQLSETLKHYTEKEDDNRTFYPIKENAEQLLKDLDEVQRITKEKDPNLTRVTDEQTEIDESRKRKLRENRMSSEILQSPCDEDATYRFKGKDGHIGYTANVIEAKVKESSVILDYPYEKTSAVTVRFGKTLWIKWTFPRSKRCLQPMADIRDRKTRGWQKNVRLVTTNLLGRYIPEQYREYRKSEEFKAFSHFRNGVETIPSMLRRKYRVNRMPVRGDRTDAVILRM